MPTNGSAPPVRPPAPKGPPPAPPPMRNPNIPGYAPKMPRRPPVKYVEDPPWHTKLIGLLLVGMFIVLLVLGLNQTFDDIRVWAKDYDLKHCLGKYDTAQCHQDRADAKARAYINAKGDL